MYDGKTLRGSITQSYSGAGKLIAQVTLFFQRLVLAIAQTTYTADASGLSSPCASCLRWLSLRLCWCKRTCCWRTSLSPYPAQEGADFLIAVKHTRRKGFRLIRYRLTNRRRIPWCTSWWKPNMAVTSPESCGRCRPRSV